MVRIRQWFEKLPAVTICSIMEYAGCWGGSYHFIVIQHGADFKGTGHCHDYFILSVN